MPLPSGLLSVAARSKFLFQWEARDHSLTARTGQVGVFTRASTGYTLDMNGRSVNVANDAPRWGSDTLGGSFGLLLEGASTNLCIRSGDLSNAAWIKNGTTTATSGQPDPFGGTSACTVACTANGDNLYQAVTFTGNAVKDASIFLKAGTSAVTDLVLYDFTASAFVMQIRATWTAGVPTLSVIGGKGVAVAAQAMAGGFYRILGSSNAITAANTNRLYLYPGGSAGQGTVIAVGAQAEDATYPSSYIPTVAATVTRAADALLLPIGFLPQALTLYAKYIERGNAASNVGISLATRLTNGNFMFSYPTATTLKAYHQTAAGNVSSGVVTAGVVGDTVEVRAVLQADGSCLLGISINSGAETVSTTSGALPLAAAWADANLYPTQPIAQAAPFVSLQQSCRVAAGVQSLAYMRAA